MVSCFSQFIQREEVGDGAAVAAGEQRAAVHGPAGVGGQHRALEEAVLGLQGGERPAEGQGSRTQPQERAPPASCSHHGSFSGISAALSPCVLADGVGLCKGGGWGAQAAASLCTQRAGREQRSCCSTWSSCIRILGGLVSAGLAGWGEEAERF